MKNVNIKNINKENCINKFMKRNRLSITERKATGPKQNQTSSQRKATLSNPKVMKKNTSVIMVKTRSVKEHKAKEKSVRQIAYGSKVLSDTEMKYGAPKAEMFAVVTFVEKNRAYLGSEPFKLGFDNRALSWLKTYSMYQSYIWR